MLISKFNTSNIEHKVREVEELYDLVLPEEYRSFLCKYNGGETPETSFRLAGVSSDLRGFFGLEIPDEYDPLEWYLCSEDISGLIAEGMFPIGTNSFGDLLLIGVGEEHFGKILFRYHDREKRYRKLADSFAEFVGNCKSKRLKPCRSIEERLAGRRAAGIFDDPPPAALREWQKEIDRYEKIHQEELVLS